MPDQILKEVTHLGSVLAELATKQLDEVSKQLGGAVGEGRDPSDVQPPRRVNAGTLAFNVLQLASKAGALLTQLSEYDLVRRNVSALALRSSNPLTSLPLQAGVGHPYELLIENEGDDEPRISISAELLTKNELGELKRLGELEIDGKFKRIFASERRHIRVKIPGLPEGTYSLGITIRQGEEGDAKVIGKKTVTLNVLPLAEQHEP